MKTPTSNGTTSEFVDLKKNRKKKQNAETIAPKLYSYRLYIIYHMHISHTTHKITSST